jgi:conjugal transfer pilus assembly protein TrbC
MDGIQKKSLLYVFLLIVFLVLLPSLALAEINIKNKHSNAIEDDINRVKKFLKSDDLRDKVQSELEKLNQTIQPSVNNDSSSTESEMKMSIDSSVYYLFISSSIPQDTLKAYAHDISEYNLPVKMILRGFVDGMKQIKPTIKFIRDILTIDEDCLDNCKTYNVSIEIDPELFREYNIKSVPALAVNAKSNIVYGDADIEYMMEKL